MKQGEKPLDEIFSWSLYKRNRTNQKGFDEEANETTSPKPVNCRRNVGPNRQ